MSTGTTGTTASTATSTTTGTSPRHGTLARRRFSALLLGATAAVAAGCSDPDDDTGPAGNSGAGAGTLTVVLPQAPASMDPVFTLPFGAVDGNRLAAVYDMLVWSDPATGTVRPHLAESLTASENGRAWTLRLRSGVTFTDGTPFDAEAVRFNWERHRDAGNRSLQLPATADIASLRVLDPLTLDVRLTRTNANFDRSVARHLAFVVSPAAIRKDPVGIGRNPVGAGPYILTHWTGDGRQVLVRNPGYWQAGGGLPHFDGLTFAVAADADRVVQDVADEHADMAVVFAPDAIADAAGRRLGVEKSTLDGGAMLVFNTAAAPFDDVVVRRAVVAALDPAVVDARFHHGEGAPTQSIFAANSPVANPQLAMPGFDPALAQTLFAQVTAGGSRPLRFVVMVREGGTPTAIGEYIRDTVNAYPGVEAQIQTADPLDFIRTVRKDEWTWNAALTQQWFSDPEPGLYDFLHSHSATNISGYRNPAVDRALDEARDTVDRAIRRHAYTTVQVELDRDVPFWVYQESAAAAVFRSDLAAVQLCNDGVILWDRVSRKP